MYNKYVTSGRVVRHDYFFKFSQIGKEFLVTSNLSIYPFLDTHTAPISFLFFLSFRFLLSAFCSRLFFPSLPLEGRRGEIKKEREKKERKQKRKRKHKTPQRLLIPRHPPQLSTECFHSQAMSTIFALSYNRPFQKLQMHTQQSHQSPKTDTQRERRKKRKDSSV